MSRSMSVPKVIAALAPLAAAAVLLEIGGARAQHLGTPSSSPQVGGTGILPW